MDCIFCDIITGTMPSNTVYQNDDIIAFRDINPQSPIHIIIIPKRHVSSLVELTDADSSLMGHMIIVANQLAKKEGVANSGYRLVINCRKQGGQLVPHIHLHLLGGRQLSGVLG
ncbi:histidine triad nucleotide-binding protein [Chloroflexota bacterium]